MAIGPNLILLSGVVSHNEDIGNISVWIVYDQIPMMFWQSIVGLIYTGWESRKTGHKPGEGQRYNFKGELSISSFQNCV